MRSIQHRRSIDIQKRERWLPSTVSHPISAHICCK
uniref:Uncharacterized protein n=1 Tax=Siphoviridae sp. ctedO8 TaxID=2827907 RepID=A0A8S5T351_9CAUD|nr:MAG TPA: hypothetical protein [Siphoviridae sp. ctedO8]